MPCTYWLVIVTGIMLGHNALLSICQQCLVLNEMKKNLEHESGFRQPLKRNHVFVVPMTTDSNNFTLKFKKELLIKH